MYVKRETSSTITIMASKIATINTLITAAHETIHHRKTHGHTPKPELMDRSTAVSSAIVETPEDEKCVNTSDVEGFKLVKLKSKVHDRCIVTTNE
jgi:hypothetical protein